MSGTPKKLTRDQVHDIRVAYRSGATQTQLAERYGVVPSAINYHLSQSLDRPADQHHCQTCTCTMRGT